MQRIVVRMGNLRLRGQTKKRKKADFVQGHGYISDLRRLSMKKTWGAKPHSRLSAATLSISVTSKRVLRNKKKKRKHNLLNFLHIMYRKKERKEAHQRLLD